MTTHQYNTPIPIDFAGGHSYIINLKRTGVYRAWEAHRSTIHNESVILAAGLKEKENKILKFLKLYITTTCLKYQL
jgi:hypothetical protein